MKGAERMAWAAAFALAIIAGSYHKLSEPSPYVVTEILEADIVDDSLLLVANFTKTDCELKRFEVVGGAVGVTQFLTWDDADGLGREYDRSNGEHTLRIQAHFDGRSYDWVEFRTRHDCDGRQVERVFFRWDNPNGEQ